MAPPELLEVHPLGKSPVITDNGKTIAETGSSLFKGVFIYKAQSGSLAFEFVENVLLKYQTLTIPESKTMQHIQGQSSSILWASMDRS